MLSCRREVGREEKYSRSASEEEFKQGRWESYKIILGLSFVYRKMFVWDLKRF